jgi:NADH dehydrogenase/NADH:ubiquinone oxidoreductase subunit G
MPKIVLEIDGKEIKAQEGMTILEAASSAGVNIPTLCHHDKLEPYGACRICSVEIKNGVRSRLVTACVYPVENGLVVDTKSDRVVKIRRMLLELMMAQAPSAKKIQDLAHEYGLDKIRFEKESSFCILCGLCVRYCAEVKKLDALTFIGRGTEREVMFIPEIAARECPPCQECFDLCPTNVLKSNFLLAQALTFNQQNEASR